MADYYPLIARAIAGLDPSAPGESRRALYERARAALIAQLRSVQPPLSESEITRERLSLEEAVRKVESEAAQRAREASRSGDGSRGGARAGDSFRATTRPAVAAGRAGSACLGATSGCPAAGASAPAFAAARAQRPAAARPGRPRAAQPSPRCRPATAAASAATADPDAGSDAAADPRTHGRAAPRPRQRSAAGAGHARLSRHRRRCRRSRPRRRAGQPLGAQDLRQRAVALAGIRPARAEHGEPRRRSRRALFL